MRFRLGEWVRTKMQSWLQIQPPLQRSVVLREQLPRELEVLRSQIWYRGDSEELRQFFSQLGEPDGSFWGTVPEGRQVRKIHTGLPAIIVRTLTYIVTADMNAPDVPGSTDWEDITKELDFSKLVGTAVADTLVSGDGAFKISIDEALSPYPIIEFIPGDAVEIEQSRGIVTAVVFKTVYTVKTKLYELRERYGRGFIESRLYNDNDKEVPLGTVPELSGIMPRVTFDGDIMLAVPLMFYASPKYKGRGASVFDGGKSDCFDALDEIVSQWVDAIRQGRVQKYIPKSLIPRSPDDGSLQRLNSFGTEFIMLNESLGDGDSEKIEVVQPKIEYEAFVASYTNALLMCLQGLISPATLGIDVGKMSSGEAQREKKDVTGDTRNTITTALETALPKLIRAVLIAYDNMQSREPGEYEPSVTFGEYGAPDFDSRVDTVGRAATQGIMSVEAQVDELWGSSKDDEFKQREIRRIKLERGLIEADPPKVGDELTEGEPIA